MVPHSTCKVVLATYLEDIPHSCLRIEDNWVIFLLLTLKGDRKWDYRVDELHPQARDHRPWGKCYWCDWEPMRMSVVNLINYLRLKRPHDLEHIPTASEEDASPPGDELTDEEKDSKEEGDNPIEVGPIEKEDPEEDPSEREPMKEEDPEEDPRKEELVEEDDPKEDPSEGESMEEEDHEEDSEVTEGQMIGSEDLKGNSS